MHARAAQLISSLGLTAHPEGGYFREAYRSSPSVLPADGRPARSALTTIYFLLGSGDVSRWHRLASDEVWHFYEGDPLELLQADDGFETVDEHLLGTYADAARPVLVVPAGRWQAARSTGEYTLVGCTVGPGFEFADFEMLDPHSASAERIRDKHPQLACFVDP